MGRPKVIRTKNGGEITLKNVDAQLSAAISDLVSGKASAPVASPPETQLVAASVYATPVTAVLNHRGIGICSDLDGIKWSVAEISFNAQTKEARVEKLTLAGEDKESASEAFRIAAVKNNLV